MPRKKSKPAAKGAAIVSQEYQVVAIDSIQPHPRNVNEGDVDSISESIATNGFIGAPIVQKSSGLIIAGKHRWLSSKKEGLTEIPVIFADVDDATALRFMLADNRTARLGADNPQALADLLQSIQNDQGSLMGTGFDEKALDELLRSLGDDVIGEEELPEGGDAEESEYEERWGVIIECDDEPAQVELLERFIAEGLKCRALI